VLGDCFLHHRYCGGGSGSNVCLSGLIILEGPETHDSRVAILFTDPIFKSLLRADQLLNYISGFPVLTLMYNTWGQSGGGSYVLLVYLITLIAGAGMISTSTGQIAAFARDGGLPYGTLFCRVSPRSNTPRCSTGFLFVGSVLLLLFSLSDNGNTIIYSLAVISTFMTNALPMTLRCFAGPRFIPGYFSLGRASIPIHAFATVSQVYFIIMQSFPPAKYWEASSFNYNWVFMILAMLGISVAWFFVKDKYRGLDLEVLKMRQVAHQRDSQPC
jgi:amino acid transporter